MERLPRKSNQWHLWELYVRELFSHVVQLVGIDDVCYRQVLWLYSDLIPGGAMFKNFPILLLYRNYVSVIFCSIYHNSKCLIHVRNVNDSQTTATIFNETIMTVLLAILVVCKCMS